MFQKTKLELILEGLLQVDQKKTQALGSSEKVTMTFLNDLMSIRMDDREMELLEAELLLNGYIARQNGELFITQNGKQSLLEGNTTVQLNTIQIQERWMRLQNERVENPKSDDLLIYGGISLLVLTLIAFVIAVSV